jgi:hypothetical protein
MASRSWRSSQPVSTPSIRCSAVESITSRSFYHGQALTDVDREMEHYGSAVAVTMKPLQVAARDSHAIP